MRMRKGKQLRKWNAEHTAPHDRAGIKAEDAEPTATVEIVLANRPRRSHFLRFRVEPAPNRRT